MKNNYLIFDPRDCTDQSLFSIWLNLESTERYTSGQVDSKDVWKKKSLKGEGPPPEWMTPSDNDPHIKRSNGKIAVCLLTFASSWWVYLYIVVAAAVHNYRQPSFFSLPMWTEDSHSLFRKPGMQDHVGTTKTFQALQHENSHVRISCPLLFKSVR